VTYSEVGSRRFCEAQHTPSTVSNIHNMLYKPVSSATFLQMSWTARFTNTPSTVHKHTLKELLHLLVSMRPLLLLLPQLSNATMQYKPLVQSRSSCLCSLCPRALLLLHRFHS
jgi:hypothetical protein